MKTPCHQDPEAWVGDNVYDRLEAARQCLACPELARCTIDALTNRPDFGVQAGIDHTPRSPKKPHVVNCSTCALPMIGYAGKRQTLDHVIPLIEGGQHTLANVRPSCAACNRRKSLSERPDPTAYQRKDAR